MVDFTIKVFKDPDPAAGDNTQPTNLAAVGRALQQLSDDYAEGKGDLAQSEKINHPSAVAIYDRSTSDWDKYGPDSAKAVDDLYDNLSYTNWDTGSPVDVGHNTTTSVEVEEAVKLAFVFEEPGMMVVPVPCKSNMERGLHAAPLRLPEAYDEVVSEGTIGFLMGIIRTLVVDGNDVPGVSPADKADLVGMSQFVNPLEKVLTDATRQKIKDLKDRPEPQKKTQFLSQVADYSVRQCRS